MSFDSLIHVWSAFCMLQLPPLYSPPSLSPFSIHVPFSHSHLWNLSRPTEFNRICCLSTGLKLCIGACWAYPWAQSWRQWLLLQDPLVTKSSVGRGRERRVASKPIHGWLWTEPVLCRPSAGSHSSCGVMTASTVPCSQKTASQGSSSCSPALLFFLLSSTVIPEP